MTSPIGFQDRFARAVRPAAVELRNVAADHQPHHPVVVDFVALQLARILAVAQDRHPVRQLLDLAQPMRDVNDADAAAAEVPHDLEQRFRLLGRQAGRGFVHDQQPRVDRQGFGDLDQLLLADGQVADQRAGRDIESHAPQHGGRFAADRPAVQNAQAVRFPAQEDVRPNVQVVGQIQFLVNQSNPARRRGPHRIQMQGLAVEQQLARIRRQDAGQDLHQRALARPVLAQQRQHFAAADSQIHVVQRGRRGTAC